MPNTRSSGAQTRSKTKKADPALSGTRKRATSQVDDDRVAKKQRKGPKKGAKGGEEEDKGGEKTKKTRYVTPTRRPHC
jgi:hypothetical protein